MNVKEIESFIEQTFTDRRLTRGEKQALHAVLSQANPRNEERRALVGHAFETARGEIGRPGARQSFAWLEKIVRLLLPEHARMARVYFNPGHDLAQEIRERLKASRQTIEICVFTITDNRLTRAVLDAHSRGVVVRVISDNIKSGDLGSDIDWLVREGVALRMDASESHMHHKFAIFDRRMVATGSYNWTRSAAEGNLENFVLSDDRRLVEAYLGEFERLWGLFASPSGSS